MTCVVVSVGGYYYKNDLPRLGQTSESIVVPEVVSTPGDPPFEIGDQVRVLLTVPVLKAMQEGHGGWNAKMEEVRK